MNPPLIVANFKSNKDALEAKTWLEEFSKGFKNEEGKDIIICPSFTLLPLFKNFINKQNLPIKLGAQDISAFSQGPYTGEVNGKQIKEFAEYVLIGHSERRSLLKENDEMIEKKVQNAISSGLLPIFFVQNLNTIIPQGIEIIVYEPPESISNVSGGVPDSPEDVSEIVQNLRKNRNFKYVLYGGSVDSQSVSNFTKLPNVDGVVAGRASLDAKEFIKLVKVA